jgi:hypothetical protein
MAFHLAFIALAPPALFLHRMVGIIRYSFASLIKRDTDTCSRFRMPLLDSRININIRIENWRYNRNQRGKDAYLDQQLGAKESKE